ncbi:hypothetical protein GCM10010145_46870 [Streptomyces ruber]|uniref:Uncharacterized protein n=2 Tax=Streptomyces TaxID=1883 RepID=A0A918BJ60_9ACTN|nr:hypothetical protein GCM10010145_46870 [Streptomyces ruber]
MRIVEGLRMQPQPVAWMAVVGADGQVVVAAVQDGAEKGWAVTLDERTAAVLEQRRRAGGTLVEPCHHVADPNNQ